MPDKLAYWLLAGLVLFFLKKLEVFFLFINFLAFLTISIYFANADRKLERSLRFDFNGFIEYFVLEV